MIVTSVTCALLTVQAVSMETDTQAVRLCRELNAIMRPLAVTVVQRVDASLMRPQSVCHLVLSDVQFVRADFPYFPANEDQNMLNTFSAKP